MSLPILVLIFSVHREGKSGRRLGKSAGWLGTGRQLGVQGIRGVFETRSLASVRTNCVVLVGLERRAWFGVVFSTVADGRAVGEIVASSVVFQAFVQHWTR